MEFISFLNKVWEEREARHILIWWAVSKESSGTIFYNVFGMTRSGFKPTTSRLRGERSNHWATAVYCFAFSYCFGVWYLRRCLVALKSKSVKTQLRWLLSSYVYFMKPKLQTLLFSLYMTKVLYSSHKNFIGPQLLAQWWFLKNSTFRRVSFHQFFKINELITPIIVVIKTRFQ